jgi:hypothetical protein
MSPPMLHLNDSKPTSALPLASGVPIFACVLSCVRSVPLSRPNWSRPLPRPLKIPSVTTLKTLADVRTLMQHLPDSHRERSTWRYVAKQLAAAADGGDINGVVISLRLVPQLEQVPCLPQR